MRVYVCDKSEEKWCRATKYLWRCFYVIECKRTAPHRDRLIVEERPKNLKPENFRCTTLAFTRDVYKALPLFRRLSFPFISICPALSTKARRLENRGTKTDRRELTIELSHLCRVKDSTTVKIFHEDKKRIVYERIVALNNKDMRKKMAIQIVRSRRL